MTKEMAILLVVMAGVTYLIRMLPLALFRRQIESRFVRSFLFYVPYAVLGAMTFPAILYATASIWSGLVGLLTAILLAWRGKGLVTVALCACGTAFVTEWLLRLGGLM